MERWATAKINLFLDVLGRRPDGYHNIATVYQSIGLADRLQFEVAAEGIDLECNDAGVPKGSENLVVRAAELMRRRFPGHVGGLRIRLEKRIPPASGLGGGSADAAATLKACNDLFDLGLSDEQLRNLGSELGADVPFLIEGGCAVGSERGDRLKQLDVRSPAWAVIAVPDVAISTHWAYEQLDRVKREPSPPLGPFIEQLAEEPVAAWARACFNAFESVVFVAHPQLEELRNRLEELGCVRALLGGSGSAVVGLTDDPACAKRVVQGLTGRFRLVEMARFRAR